MSIFLNSFNPTLNACRPENEAGKCLFFQRPRISSFFSSDNGVVGIIFALAPVHNCLITTVNYYYYFTTACCRKSRATRLFFTTACCRKSRATGFFFKFSRKKKVVVNDLKGTTSLLKVQGATQGAV